MPHLSFDGEEAKAIIEFMEAEELPTPAAAVRALIAAALSVYPDWASTISGRRSVLNEQRLWGLNRTAQHFRDLANEIEMNIQEDFVKKENEVIDQAMGEGP